MSGLIGDETFDMVFMSAATDWTLDSDSERGFEMCHIASGRRFRVYRGYRGYKSINLRNNRMALCKHLKIVELGFRGIFREHFEFRINGWLCGKLLSMFPRPMWDVMTAPRQSWTT